MILGVIFGLSTAFLQAMAYIFMRRSLSEFPESMAFFMNAVTGVLVWVPFALLTNGVLADVPKVLPIALLSAILSEAFVFYATAKGDSIVTGVLFSTYPLFTIFFAFFFLQEHLVFLAWAALLFVIIGTLVVSAPSRKEWLENQITHWKFHLIAWPLIAALAVGVSDVAGKSIIDQTSAGTFLIALAIAEIPVSIVFLYMQKQTLRQVGDFFKKFNEYKFAFLSGLFSTLAVLALWLAFEVLPASVASPLTAITPIFVFILGILFLKDTVSFKNTVGLLIVTLGILLLSLNGF